MYANNLRAIGRLPFSTPAAATSLFLWLVVTVLAVRSYRVSDYLDHHQANAAPRLRRVRRNRAGGRISHERTGASSRGRPHDQDYCRVLDRADRRLRPGSRGKLDGTLTKDDRQHTGASGRQSNARRCRPFGMKARTVAAVPTGSPAYGLPPSGRSARRGECHAGRRIPEAA